MAGLQETRHFTAKHAKTKHYHCFCSQDRKGNLGCQIWVAAAWLVATRGDGCQGFFDTDTVTFVHSFPRILALCIKAGDQLFGIVSAHSPISDAPQEERIQWWDDLRGVLRQLPREATPILLADCNARFDATGPSAEASTCAMSLPSSPQICSIRLARAVSAGHRGTATPRSWTTFSFRLSWQMQL